MMGICTVHPERHEFTPDCVQWDGSEETRLREELAEVRRKWRQLVDDMEANSVDGWAAAERAATARATAAESALAEARGALRERGIHDRKCGAVTVPGRFGSQEGLRWNQSTDPLSCTCPLGVAILGCELGKRKEDGQ